MLLQFLQPAVVYFFYVHAQRRKKVNLKIGSKDIDEAYQFIKSNNIAIVKEIESIGNFAYFNFQDPDGNVLMICNG
ncbi:VOC family protein [Peribacillus frigoritolerans]|uniref:VOC family protein n=1 Tax=Peribacillus frigoritolerans TaxID=450367 RepID=UPI0035CCF374